MDCITTKGHWYVSSLAFSCPVTIIELLPPTKHVGTGDTVPKRERALWSHGADIWAGDDQGDKKSMEDNFKEWTPATRKIVGIMWWGMNRASRKVSTRRWLLNWDPNNKKQPCKNLELELPDRGNCGCKALGWRSSYLVGLSFQSGRSLVWWVQKWNQRNGLGIS